jgi:hypothetical protein
MAEALTVEARIAALEAQVQRLTLLLERGRPDRDEADAALRAVLAISTRGLPFTSGELVAHARVDADLRRALLAADVVTRQGVGTWLRDHSGTHHGISILRLPGRRWQARHVAHDVQPI